MKITYLGHGCLHIDTGNHTLLIDPFISGNPLAKDLNVDDISADFILITHGHVDHVLDVERIAKRTGALLISNYEIVTYYQDKHDLQGHPMNHGGAYNFDFGRVKYVAAVHSSVLPDGTYAGNPGGFVIESEGKVVYVAGDTALTMDMKLIPMTCPALDLAVMPIGDNFTMGYADAAIASDFVACGRVLGCHYDSFPPIKIDKGAAQAYFAERGKTLLLPGIGEAIEV